MNALSGCIALLDFQSFGFVFKSFLSCKHLVKSYHPQIDAECLTYYTKQHLARLVLPKSTGFTTSPNIAGCIPIKRSPFFESGVDHLLNLHLKQLTCRDGISIIIGSRIRRTPVFSFSILALLCPKTLFLNKQGFKNQISSWEDTNASPSQTAEGERSS